MAIPNGNKFDGVLPVVLSQSLVAVCDVVGTAAVTAFPHFFLRSCSGDGRFEESNDLIKSFVKLLVVTCK